MPDTGAPWNIPYVEAADLVSDWPADSLALANAIDAGLDAAGNAGIGSNVVSTFKNNTFSTTSTSLVPITGLSATITPTTASSKVLVVVHIMAGTSTSARQDFQLKRGVTAIAASSGGVSNSTFTNVTGDAGFGVSFAFLDSPATTSATTYSVEVLTSAGTVYVNRIGGSDRRGTSTITAIEVAA